VGCSGSSTTKDAAPVPDGPAVAADVANTPKLDATRDLVPVLPADAPVADGPVADGAVATPDRGVDSLPVVPDTGPVVTPDAALDNLSVADRPIATTDVPADSPADAAADAGADGSGDATDALPVACTPFTGGPVASNLTLAKACSPYTITDDIGIDGNAILTVEPGVTLKFTDSVGIDVGYTSSGKLVAVGTAQNPITFTSAATTPGPGDWRGIRFWDGTMNGVQIAYAKLDYCGADRNACVVGTNVKPNRVTLDHLTIDNVGQGANGILEETSDSNFVITNSTFRSITTARTQQFAISVAAASFAGIGAGNTFDNAAMIELRGGTVASTISWVDPGADIAVTDNLNVDGSGSPVLTLGPGLMLLFDAGLELSVGYATGGKLVIAGTAASHVVFTSFAASPAVGDWAGIKVWADGKAQISYADIAYGGSDGTNGGNVILEKANSTSQLAVDHSAFSFSLGYGIYLDCAIVSSPPLATVTLDPSNTYANNEADMTGANDEAHNVGPGLVCPPH
jgi:hypothetical protein